MTDLVQLWVDKESKLNGVLEGGETFKINPPIDPYCYVLKSREHIAGYWIKKYGMDAIIEDTDMKTLKGEPVVKVNLENPDQRYVITEVVGNTYEADVDYLFQIREALGWRTGKDYRLCFFDTEWNDKKEILTIGACFSKCYKCFKEGKFDYKLYSGSEENIINEFVNDLKQVDLLVTYGGEEYDIPIIKERCDFYGLVFPNIHHLDFEVLLRGFGQRQLFSYKLGWVSKHFLGRERKYSGSIAGLTQKEIEERVRDDTEILVELERKLRLVEVAIAKAYLCNLFPEDTYFMATSIEALLLPKAHEMGYVLNNKGGEKVKHSGAFVMKPPVANKPIENVAYLDFWSLYPNIIIKFKISPEPEKRLYPELLSYLLELRKQYPKDKDYAMNQAIKELANSFYGWLSYANSRCFYPELGNEVATRGRQIIQNVINEIGKTHEIVYSDTDAICVRCSRDEVDFLIRKSQDIIREKFGIELKMELKDYFRKLMFFRKGKGEDIAKKRYAGINEKGEIVMVGIESIRSDIPEIVADFQDMLVKMLLNGNDINEIREFVRHYRQSLILQPVEKFVMSKTLGKAQDKYKVEPPHIKALKQAKKKGIEFRTGDKIPYLWVRGEPVFYEEGNSYEVDINYYWRHYLEGVLIRTLGDKL
jgi:DNA polymerase elongation subunit (family B)